MSDLYIKSLDGVRAIAIIIVMTFHAGITHFGWMGVQLFFVLSGFLITGILWKEKNNATPVSFKLKKFWVRRSLRIFPLYWLYLLLVVLVYFLFQVPPAYYDYFGYLITYTFNFTRSSPGWIGDPFYTHLWSLCIEEQFYVFFPFLIFFFPPRFIKYFMVAIIILSPLTRFLLGQYYDSKGLTVPVVADSVYWNTLSHLDAFFMGGVIHVLSLKTYFKKPHVIFSCVAALALLAGVWNFTHSNSGSFFFNDLGYNNGATKNYEHVWHYTILNLVFSSFILLIVSPYSQLKFLRIRSFLESKWMVNIGKVSYGMYVFHWGILYYVYERFFSTESLVMKLALFVPYVLLVYFVAWLSYNLFESRFIKLKDKFFANIPNPKTSFASSNRIP